MRKNGPEDSNTQIRTLAFSFLGQAFDMNLNFRPDAAYKVDKLDKCLWIDST